MGTVKRGLESVLIVTLLWSAAPAASAESFDSFCAQWMGKLEQREKQNLAKVHYARGAGGVEGKYTGYERVPVRCQTRAKPGKPGVGTLVYHELKYKKSGATVEQAKSSAPQVVEKTEVMEIFRFDGQKWKY
jgi:hypothetical protein